MFIGVYEYEVLKDENGYLFFIEDFFCFFFDVKLLVS